MEKRKKRNVHMFVQESGEKIRDFAFLPYLSAQGELALSALCHTQTRHIARPLLCVELPVRTKDCGDAVLERWARCAV